MPDIQVFIFKMKYSSCLAEVVCFSIVREFDEPFNLNP